MSCGNPSERSLVLDDRTVHYDLHRSTRRRKRIFFGIEERRLRVLVPKRIRQRDIDAILRQRSRWILERLDAPEPPRLSEQIRAGGTLPLMGLPTSVTLAQGPTRLEDERLVVDEDAADVAAEAQRYLREVAREQLAEAVGRWSIVVGAAPKRLQVRDQKTRWGSASASGTLSLNWRLIFAPPDVLEYVVVHELCHLKRLDHSAEYWSLVASHLPSYAEHRSWLKQHGDSLRW